MVVPYEFDAERFSRWMAYVLRHNPGRYGLLTDRHGFVDLDLFEQIACRRYPQVEPAKLRELMTQATGRFEIAENRLRARYGHSIPVDPAGAPIEPPERLYYGTDAPRAQLALQEGLRPSDRRLLHLSDTLEDALSVARRKIPEPVVLCAQAREAHQSGLAFYLEHKVYLTAALAPRFLSLL